MKRICGISRLALAGVAVIASLSTFGVAGAWAEPPTWLCVPKTAGKTVTSGGISTKATCEKETVLVELPPASEMPTLVNILSHVKYEASGIDSQPTIRISGINVQIVNGAGTTATTNGKGNLVIGYDEAPGPQTGSHNLILGGEQVFESYGGILAGFHNVITGPYASVTGGFENTAAGEYASVTGGSRNTANANSASVGGGEGNTATGRYASVSGGRENTATGERASVSGGSKNAATRAQASISGGLENKAEESGASVLGGYKNKASGQNATVSGGEENTASGNFSSILGGRFRMAAFEWERLS